MAGHGALGDFFATNLAGVIKMGDTPSVGWALDGHTSDPAKPGWGGRYVRAWSRAPATFDRMTTAEDRMEQFGVLQLNVPGGALPGAKLRIENQLLDGDVDASGTLRFRFSPKDAKTYDYTIEGGGPGFDGQRGRITSVRPAPDADRHPDKRWPNWWTDVPSLDAAEGAFLGARTVSQWRLDFLRDFAARMDRCQRPRA